MGLETIALATAVGSTALSAYGAYEQGQASKAAAGYNAQLAANNAKVAQQNAAYAGAEGDVNAGNEGMKTRATVGAITANQGASGVRLDSGSSVATRESAAKVGMLNQQTIRSNAARTAYGYQTQAANATAQGQLYNYESKMANQSSYINAGSTILGGAGRALNNYQKFLLNNDNTGNITSTPATADITINGGYD